MGKSHKFFTHLKCLKKVVTEWGYWDKHQRTAWVCREQILKRRGTEQDLIARNNFEYTLRDTGKRSRKLLIYYQKKMGNHQHRKAEAAKVLWVVCISERKNQVQRLANASSSSRAAGSLDGNAEGGISTLFPKVSTLPEPGGFYPRTVWKNTTKVMSEPLGVICGESWSIKKHQKAGKGQIYQSAYLQMPEKPWKGQNHSEHMKGNKEISGSPNGCVTCNPLRALVSFYEWIVRLERENNKHHLKSQNDTFWWYQMISYQMIPIWYLLQRSSHSKGRKGCSTGKSGIAQAKQAE